MLKQNPMRLVVSLQNVFRMVFHSSVIARGGWQVPSRGLLGNTKLVDMRAATVTRVGCVRRGVGHYMPFSWCGSRNAEDDPRPIILQMNTKGVVRGG